MTKDEKDNIEEQDLVEEMQEEINEIENEEGEIDEVKLEEAQTGGISEIDKLKDTLARSQADFVNFQQRTQRDKEDMIFFLKSDILKKVLPRIDDLERMIINTPEEMKIGALYEGIISMQTKLLTDLDKMGVKPFNSK
jgi:molecular chaperone GrpE